MSITVIIIITLSPFPPVYCKCADVLISEKAARVCVTLSYFYPRSLDMYKALSSPRNSLRWIVLLQRALNFVCISVEALWLVHWQWQVSFRLSLERGEGGAFSYKVRVIRTVPSTQRSWPLHYTGSYFGDSDVKNDPFTRRLSSSLIGPSPCCPERGRLAPACADFEAFAGSWLTEQLP